MYRGIFEDPLYEAQRDAINPDCQRMDTILSGLMWALHENAEQFFKVLPDRNLWIAKTDPFPNAPRLRVWFTLDAVNVTLLSMERIQTEDEG